MSPTHLGCWLWGGEKLLAAPSTLLNFRPAGGVGEVPLSITENGVAKVKAADVLATPQAQRDLAAVEKLRRTSGVAVVDGETFSPNHQGMNR